MTEIAWTWIDKDGNEMDQHDGYYVHDYFDPDIANLRFGTAEWLEGIDPSQADALLTSAYRGKDCDGVGLRWLVF